MARQAHAFVERLWQRPLPQAILPEKLKGGRIQRWLEYWAGVAKDYQEALSEIVQGL